MSTVKPATLPLGHYEAVLTTKEGVGRLDILPVIKLDKNISLPPLKPLATPTSSPEASTAETVVNSVAEKDSDKDKILAFSSIAKTAMPKLMQKKAVDSATFPEGRVGLIFTEQQRKGIYDAIKNDEKLIKIRRALGGAPGEKVQRSLSANKALTELEKNLNLEFSVIIDDNKEPIALFRGKDYAIGAGGLGQVKFGQRLSDGKWVAVKIQKYDLSNLIAMKARLQLNQTSLDNELLNLEAQNLKLKDTSLPESEVLNIIEDIAYIKAQINHLQFNKEVTNEEMDKLEKSFKNKKDMIANETKIATEVNVQSGSAELQSGSKEKFYAVQTLFEGHELFEHVADKKSSVYIDDVGERLNIGLLALKGLKEFHDKNIIHGDVKLDNMIYLRDMDPKTMQMIDFGFSMKLPENETKIVSGSRGTPGYRAPEVAQTGISYKASDIYSMSTLFSYMLSKPYFRTEPVEKEVDELIYKMRRTDPNNRITVDEAIVAMEKIIQNYENTLSTRNAVKP